MAKLFSLPYGPRYFWRNIPYLWSRIKFFYLRGKNGWCPYDAWDIDCYLLKILPEMLRYLAKNSHSHPVLTKPMTKESSDKDAEEWKKILIYMAECFEEADEHMFPFDGDGDIENLEALEKYRDKKKDEGLDLLKKYFWDLWD